MTGNRNYYSSDHDQTPITVDTYSKNKLEPKVMLWIAISPKNFLPRFAVTVSGRSMSDTAST